MSGQGPVPFDLLGDLPSGTVVLEASAGTGKTYAVGALVARFVAEGRASLEEMLVITFGRAASQELRERVREQLVEAERALADPAGARRAGGLLALLAGEDDAEAGVRRARLRDALASFDAATIATTHQFCQLVLRSLGVAGDTDAHARLVEDLDELVVEVVDDLYLARFGDDEAPPLSRSLALEIARKVIDDPQAVIASTGPESRPGFAPEPGAEPDTPIAHRVSFARDVRAEVERRKRRLGILSYDDLLSRLATALEAEDAPARERMRQRWRIVLVDEFQDTDPVQWSVLARAFGGDDRPDDRPGAAMVLIGDPKQAIYAFRGGDIVTYLGAVDAVGGAGIRTLATNWRSDKPLVDALRVLLQGTSLGDPRIVVHPVEASEEHRESRLRGAPGDAPLRIRSLPGTGLGLSDRGTASIADVRERIAADLADDVATLLASGATYDGRAVEAGDVAVLMYSLNHAQLFRDALAARGIPSVVGGGASVLTSPAGEHWLTLLEALEQPHRAPRVRAVALTPFLGHTAAELDAGGEELTDDLAEQVRLWLDLIRARGVAAVYEAVLADGLTARVLARPDGERLLTDLNHLAQLLHEVARRERLGLPALLGWLRTERRAATRNDARTRRLDTDAHAVQFTTIHASKGLQHPIVYLPLAFNRWVASEETTQLFHDGDVRTIDVSGRPVDRAASEAAGEELRLAYVALTRAQSQVVAWVAPTRDSATAGLSRMLLGRGPADPVQPIPDRITEGRPDEETWAALSAWEAAGAIRAERVGSRQAPVIETVPSTAALTARTLDRELDTAWRRTSYSGLIRIEEEQGAVSTDSEPESVGTVDEPEQPVTAESPVAETVAGLPSPMEDLPAGAAFGSLVHGVLEVADPHAPDLLAELREHVVEQLRWWSVPADADAIAAGLLPMQHTPLGPLAGDLSLAEIGLSDRLCELDFEFPLTGGDDPVAETVLLSDLAGVLRRHLAVDDPMRAYADRLESPLLGGQILRGYLSGSIDVVLRVPGADQRFVVVDYKTNRLGEVGRPLTSADYTPRLMTEAMLHSHYPLQALLYSVVLHRYLRWRVPGYDPERHLGGILYLYVRGMCGPETPVVDGQPCGVFAWRPPAAMVVELSDVLAGFSTRRLGEEVVR